eukprot:c28455_g1_i1 orf=54-347(+)
MAGYGSFCIDESSVDAPGDRKSGAPVCGQQGTLNLTHGQASNGGKGLASSILAGKEQDIMSLALLQKYYKTNLTSGVSLPCTPCSVQGNTRRDRKSV